MNDQSVALAKRVDIVDLVGAHVTLKKNGKTHWGLCPFHADKNPSFSVDPEKNRYKCWSCQESGDPISWVMKTRGIDFKAAVGLLTGESDTKYQYIAPERVQRSEPMEERDPEWVKKATELCKEAYKALPGSPGEKYLSERGISLATAQVFRLGYYAKKSSVVVPWAFDGQVEHVKFKPTAPRASPKYLALPGGSPSIFGQKQLRRSGKFLCVVEGELNAMSIYQAAPDWDVLSTGARSVTENGMSRLRRIAREFSYVVVWMDELEDAAKVVKGLAHKHAFALETAILDDVKWDANELLQASPAKLPLLLAEVLRRNGAVLPKVKKPQGGAELVEAEKIVEHMPVAAPQSECKPGRYGLSTVELEYELLEALWMLENQPETRERNLAVSIVKRWLAEVYEGRGDDFAKENANTWVAALRPFYPGFSDLPISGDQLVEMAQGVLQ